MFPVNSVLKHNRKKMQRLQAVCDAERLSARLRGSTMSYISAHLTFSTMLVCACVWGCVFVPFSEFSGCVGLCLSLRKDLFPAPCPGLFLLTPGYWQRNHPSSCPKGWALNYKSLGGYTCQSFSSNLQILKSTPTFYTFVSLLRKRLTKGINMMVWAVISSK